MMSRRMTGEDLKASLYLQLFSGKLTEQRPEDGTAQYLLDTIRKENKNKKVSHIVRNENGEYYEIRGKTQVSVTDELPFEIPETWAWVHLDEVAVSGLGKTLNKSKDSGEEKPYLCSINVYWDGIHLDEVKTAAFSESDIEKYRLQKNDLLICEGGDAGRTAIWENDEEMYYQNALHRVRFYGNIDPHYFLALMEFYKLNGTITRYCKGVTIKHLVQGSLNAMFFPLPPFAEQKRIVAKIEELMPLVEQYSSASTKLTTLNTSFPDQMKKSILQQAVEGKLVPQDPNDEPASVLLERIRKEKEKLVKEGKIKKQKPLDPITEEEKPFDIPDSWEWVRLGEALDDVSDGTHLRPHYTNTGIPFISVKDIHSGHISFDDCKYVSKEDAEKINARCNPKRGDMLITKVGSNTGIPAIVDTDAYFSLFVSVALLKYNHACIVENYLYYLLMSPLVQEQCKEATRGVGNPNWVLRDIMNTVVALPPYREQLRISDKVKTLIPKLELMGETLGVQKSKSLHLK